MIINYTLNTENKIVGWSSYPIKRHLPTIDIAEPNKIILGFDKIIDGEYISGAAEFEAKKNLDAKRENLQRQIEALKIKLQESDYRLYKYIEGFYTEEEYAPYKTERQSWRNEINQLEAQLKN